MIRTFMSFLGRYLFTLSKRINVSTISLYRHSRVVRLLVDVTAIIWYIIVRIIMFTLDFARIRYDDKIDFTITTQQ